MDEKNMCMRVGIISDVQMNTYDQDWGERNLEKAFGMLQSMNIDLLFHVGDLANNTDLEVFDKYLAIKKKYFAFAFCGGTFGSILGGLIVAIIKAVVK